MCVTCNFFSVWLRFLGHVFVFALLRRVEVQWAAPRQIIAALAFSDGSMRGITNNPVAPHVCPRDVDVCE
jgi:hypothetical protein